MAGAKASRFEQIVHEFVINRYPKLVIQPRSRVIKKTRSGKSRYELDIYIPELKLAFEVQDFATHSRDSDAEKGHPWRRNGLKNGPKLHELKRELAWKQLEVTVIDIWEDEILNGVFKEIVTNAIELRLGTM